MRLMKGKVMISPILEEVSSLIKVEQKKVFRANVIKTGEAVKVSSGMVVLLNGISMKKFKDSDDGTLVIDELDILGYEL
jgi:hypothetical protein